MNKSFREYLNFIANFYGCNIIFTNNQGGGGYRKNCIWLGVKTSNKNIIGAFCHELAHHKNTIEGKHKIYHNLCDASKGVELYGYSIYANIMLKAELYTEKVGKQICGVWFPNIKYHAVYKNNNYWKSWIRGYCFALIK